MLLSDALDMLRLLRRENPKVNIVVAVMEWCYNKQENYVGNLGEAS